MSKYAIWLLGCLLFAALTGAIDSRAQETEQKVAILVVDVFENRAESQPHMVEDSAGNCVVSIDGQDGFRWQGTADAITSALHPYQLSHGQQVYSVVDTLLSDQFGATGSVVTTSGTPLEEFWIRNVRTWGNDEFYLIGVDIRGIVESGGTTIGYQTQAILDRIRDAIAAAYDSEQITNFVINMSFAIIPCDNYPEATFHEYVDYFDIEQFVGLELKDMCDEAAQAIIEEGEFVQVTAADDCISLADRADPVIDPEDPDYENLLAAAHEAGHILLEVLGQPTFLPLREFVHQSFLRQRLLTVLENTYQDLTFLEGDVLTDFFIEGGGVQAYCTSLDDGMKCVAVAAAGNEGSALPPYAPASFPGVIAVGAEYSLLQSCPPSQENALKQRLGESGLTTPQVNDAVASLVNPQSNMSEVVMDGVLDIPISPVFPCLRAAGSSFAAPRLSYEYALHFANGGTAGQCEGVGDENGTPTPFFSDPPLNFADGASGTWESLEFDAAKDKYCVNF